MNGKHPASLLHVQTERSIVCELCKRGRGYTASLLSIRKMLLSQYLERERESKRERNFYMGDMIMIWQPGLDGICICAVKFIQLFPTSSSSFSSAAVHRSQTGPLLFVIWAQCWIIRFYIIVQDTLRKGKENNETSFMKPPLFCSDLYS